MNRRDVLKLGGALSLALLLNASPLGALMRSPTHASAKGALFRGSRNGSIFTSTDNGHTWTQMVSFGPAYVVRGVMRDRGGDVYARLQYGTRTFDLRLAPDGKNWLYQ